MRLAFILTKYAWYLGGPRDFMRIAQECQKRGHEVVFYTYSWQGAKPEGLEINFLEPERSTYQKEIKLAAQIKRIALSQRFDGVFGELKIPGLDVYYASVTCYAQDCKEKHGHWYTWLPHYKRKIALEREVFGPQSNTTIIYISERVGRTYQRHYGTSDKRMKMIHSTLDPIVKQFLGSNRADIRRKNQMGQDKQILLFVGTNFRRKGLSRAILALSSLNGDMLMKTHMYVVGNEMPKRQRKYERIAKHLNVYDNMSFLGLREDVHELMVASDILVHPAHIENTGSVIIESIASGLPVLTTEACGYAVHVEKADAGMVVGAPFKQADMNTTLAHMLTAGKIERWRRNGLEYGKNPDLYRFAEKATDIIEQSIEQKKSLTPNMHHKF